MNDSIYMFLAATAILSGSIGIGFGSLIGYRSGKEEGERNAFEEVFRRAYESGYGDATEAFLRKFTFTSRG